MVFEDVPRPVRDCYHIYSDGTRHSVLFETVEDKVYAMNLLAILAFHFGLKLLATVVMDTHFHVVARGPQEKVGKYISEIRRLISKYFHRTGRPDLLKKGILIDWDPLLDESEVMRKIIYVFRNGVDAGFPLLPECYPWGAGRAYFQRDNLTVYRRVGDLGIRERARQFRTRVRLPDEWLYDDKGMLVPSTYLDIEYVENELFRSQKRFLAFLHVRKKDLADQDWQCARGFLEKHASEALRDKVGRMALKHFNRPTKMLSETEKLFIAKELWQKRETISLKQLARAVRLDPDLLIAILH